MTYYYDPDPPTYHEADRALERAFWRAVGWCLQYGIAVFVGVHWRSLGDMRDDIQAHRAINGLDLSSGDPVDRWTAARNRERIHRKPTYFGSRR